MKLIITILLLFSVARADENILPLSEIQAQGFVKWTPSFLISRQADIAPHSLSWPVQFQDASHNMGNVMAQFQPFGDPYFHGGCDLRVKAGAEIRSPVSGHLEAGHYSYVTNPDGSMEKYWKPWPASGSETYFEVAVVTDEGVRFEFHHVNKRTLPKEIVEKLNAGGGTVEAGDVVGYVIRWMTGDYHHAHYNIVLPDGVRLNPEFASPLLPDTSAPKVSGVYAVYRGTEGVEFGNGRFEKAPIEFVVAVIDKKDLNVYEHPPAFARLVFESGPQTSWDFREKLLGPDGRFPNLFEFFMEELRVSNGRRLRTEGGYGTGQSLVRLRVPANARGPFAIEVGDMAGNVTVFKGEIL